MGAFTTRSWRDVSHGAALASKYVIVALAMCLLEAKRVVFHRVRPFLASCFHFFFFTVDLI